MKAKNTEMKQTSFVLRKVRKYWYNPLYNKGEVIYRICICIIIILEYV